MKQKQISIQNVCETMYFWGTNSLSVLSLYISISIISGVMQMVWFTLSHCRYGTVDYVQ